jgi:hypothetical protein
MTLLMAPHKFPKSGDFPPRWSAVPGRFQPMRERVRAEWHRVATLHELAPCLPSRVAGPVAAFARHLDALRQAQQDAPSHRVGQADYATAYAAYILAQERVGERQRYLIDYGYALLDQLPPSRPEAKELAARLARAVPEAGHSLASMLTSQCALDRVIEKAERALGS